ncbi:MAG: acylphosphatase [Solirubrobacterales bacterium]|nr:acylphosphatase [Solirubrobacterales bacterium]
MAASESRERSRRRFIAHGDVQGVFFRDSTRRRAGELGLSGWVRNTPEGTVEGIFEGSPEAVEAALSFVREGPGQARIEKVEETAEEPEGLDGFELVG